MARGSKTGLKSPISHFFLILHNWLLQKLRFWEWHEISRCGIFLMAQNVKTLNLDKIEHFCWKHAVYTKLWKYKPILLPMCFLVDLVREKKNIINIGKNVGFPFFRFFSEYFFFFQISNLPSQSRTNHPTILLDI